MGGFGNEAINNAFDCGFINHIIAHLINCSKQMRSDCIDSDNFLRNNEDGITNRLTSVYLNNKPDDIFRYLPQSPEQYDITTDHYIGRTDIQVISRNHFFQDAKAYHVIECKRIDGTLNLNRKYVTEGVERFFSPSPNPKYSSYYRQNIMFGYVVESIVIPDNTEKIDCLQFTLLKGAAASKFVLNSSDNSKYYEYRCNYDSDNIGKIILSHLFYDFSDVICKNLY